MIMHDLIHMAFFIRVPLNSTHRYFYIAAEKLLSYLSHFLGPHFLLCGLWAVGCFCRP